VCARVCGPSPTHSTMYAGCARVYAYAEPFRGALPVGGYGGGCRCVCVCVPCSDIQKNCNRTRFQGRVTLGGANEIINKSYNIVVGIHMLAHIAHIAYRETSVGTTESVCHSSRQVRHLRHRAVACVHHIYRYKLYGTIHTSACSIHTQAFRSPRQAVQKNHSFHPDISVISHPYPPTLHIA